MNHILGKCAGPHYSSMLLLICIVVCFAGFTMLRDTKIKQAINWTEDQFSSVAKLEKLCMQIENLDKLHNHSDGERRKLDLQFLALVSATDGDSERLANVLVRFGRLFSCPDNDQQSQQCLKCLVRAIENYSRLSSSARLQDAKLVARLQSCAQDCRFDLAEAYTRFGQLDEAEKAYREAFAHVPAKVPASFSDPNYDRFVNYANFLQASGNFVQAGRLRLQLESENKIEIPSVQAIKSQTASCVTGRWEMAFFIADSGGDFKLVLDGSGERVVGRYCAMERVEFPYFDTQNTLKMKEPSMHGTFKDGVAKLKLRTNAGQIADVTIVRIGHYLIWSLNNWQNINTRNPPNSDPYVIPFTTILKRCS